MTAEEADKTYGPVLLRTQHYVLRAKQDGEHITAYAHALKDGVEQRPLGYVLGSNAMDTKW